MGIIQDELHDLHLLRLTKTMSPILSLAMHRWSPIKLSENRMCGGVEGDTDTSRLQVADEELTVRIVLKAVDFDHRIPSFTGESCNASTFLAQIINEPFDNVMMIGKDNRLFITLFEIF
jgi:hypothetical protein